MSMSMTCFTWGTSAVKHHGVALKFQTNWSFLESSNNLMKYSQTQFKTLITEDSSHSTWAQLIRDGKSGSKMKIVMFVKSLSIWKYSLGGRMLINNSKKLSKKTKFKGSCPILILIGFRIKIMTLTRNFRLFSDPS